MSLQDLVGAIRASDGEDDPDLAAATQLRVRRSLEVRARGRHQLIGVLTTIAILFAGTVSWALATGHVTALWAPVAPPPVVPAPAAPAPPVSHHRAALATATPPVLPPEPVSPEAVSPEAVPPEAVSPEAVPAPVVVPPVVPSPPPPAAPPAVEALYRTAHDLHFHGGDPAATLAAWDRYLAAEPEGRFAVDARYNRGLVLARLGRYDEARAALLPFARSAVEPAGYRQREAEQLVERLEHSR